MKQKCPKCNNNMWGLEYAYGHPQRYDGVSEWQCTNTKCNIRIGRWSEKILKDKECEIRFGGKLK